MKRRELRLSELARHLSDHGLLIADTATDTIITGITDDSRHIVAGDLYCAWSGTTTDAHDFAAAAVRAGAAALLVERAVDDVPAPQLVVRNGRHAAALAASLYYGRPEERLRLAGVTGTNGKTTSVWVLRHMLAQSEPTASLGTLGAILEDGSILPGSESLTTPGPIELARTLRVFVDRGVRNVAMEVSSHALDQGRVHALRFDVGVFTNFTRDHLDYHGTLETYLGAKRSFVRLLHSNGCAVVNAAESAWDGLVDEAPRRLTFAVGGDADVVALDVSLHADGATFALHSPLGNAAARVPLPGAFNVENALGAAAACLALGYTVEATVSALATVPQVPGRLERIADQPCPVLRDYAHTPDALERVLLALRHVTRGRLIVLFGAGGDRDRGKRPQMGAIAERFADIAIVTSDNPRTEDPDTIIDDIERGMPARGHTRIADRRAAIAHALDIAGPGDVVLLAGKGHENYQIIGTEKRPFDEREIVRSLVESRP